jgi:hypothetical protein
MKKREVDHILRAAGRITHEKQFIIVGSQALHGKYPDLADDIVRSAEVDLFAKNRPEKTDSLNAIGVYSTFHEQYGYYADPVDDKTATLPKGWRARLVNLPPGDTDGVQGLCLDPHDLAIAKYVAAREKDVQFNRQLISRGLLDRGKLLHLLQATPINDTQRAQIAASIELDFGIAQSSDLQAPGKSEARGANIDGPGASIEETQAAGAAKWSRRQQHLPRKSPGMADDAESHAHESEPRKDLGESVDDDLEP